MMIVAAVDGYAHMHGISASEAFDILRKYDVFTLIRKHYEVLHTQSLDECAEFADDVVTRLSA